MTQTQSPNHPPPTSPKAPGRAVAGLLVGILLFMLGLGLLGNEIRSLTWRIKARFWY